MSNEPVLTVAGITAIVTAVLGSLVAFHVVDLSKEQQAALMSVVAVVAPLVVAFARNKVTPVLADLTDPDDEAVSDDTSLDGTH